MTLEFDIGLKVQNRHPVCNVAQTFSVYIYIAFHGKDYSRQVKKISSF